MNRPLTQATGAVLVVIALASALAAATFDGTHLRNDTAQYLSVAENLRAGRGFVTSIIYYEEHYSLRSVPAPQTVFPPGYPGVIATAAATGISIPTAAFVVDLLSWAASIWLLYSIVLARGHRPVVALGCAVAFACAAQSWYHVHQMLSEPLFVALTLAATRFLVGSERRSVVWCALAGLCAAAAITVRYAGVFFAVAGGMVFAVELLRRYPRRTLLHGGAFSTPVVAVAAVLFWRNHSLVGDFRGGNAYEVVKPFGSVLYTALKSLADAAGLDARAGPAEVAALAALVLAVALFVRVYGSVSLDVRTLAAALRDRAVLLPAIYALVTLIGLLHLERTTSVGLSSRMLAPLVPYAFLFAIEAARTVRFGGRTPRTLARVTLAATALAYLAGQADVARAEIECRPPNVEIARALAEPLGETTVGTWLRTRASDDHPVLGNEPQLLGAMLGRPVVGLASPEYTSRTWTVDAARKLIRAYGVEYIILLPELLTAQRADKRPLVFAELAAGRVPPWLTSVHASSAVRLYRVRSLETAATSEAP